MDLTGLTMQTIILYYKRISIILLTEIMPEANYTQPFTIDRLYHIAQKSVYNNVS